MKCDNCKKGIEHGKAVSVVFDTCKKTYCRKCYLKWAEINIPKDVSNKEKDW
jgi:hypothetical protein